jgi:uncharacterized protein YecT (DUF1311 family)
VIGRTLVAAAFAASLGFSSGDVHAQLIDCAHAETQGAMTMCAGAAAKAADGDLNKTYDTLIARIDDKHTIALLRDAEKAWIAYRDKECGFETSLTVGGSIHPMVVAQCLETLTRARQKELQRQLDCQEGDMSCVALKEK